MSNRAKVIFISREQLERLCRGQYLGIRNWPSGGKLMATAEGKHCGADGIGCRVHSDSYDPVEHGKQLPVVQATFFTNGSDQ